MVKRTRTRRLSYTLLVLAALLAAGRASAQPAVRCTPDDSNVSLPINLVADDAATWVENGVRVILLKGRVVLDQGTVQARMSQAVVWIDEEGQKKVGVYRVQMFAEGNVSLSGPMANSGDGRALPAALLTLSTRPDVNVKTYGSRILKQALPQDPLYQMAVAERARPAAAAVPNKPPAPLPPALPSTTLPRTAAAQGSAPPAPRQDAAFRLVSAQEQVNPVVAAPVQTVQGAQVPVPPAPPNLGAPPPGAGQGPPELPAPRPVEPELREETPSQQVSIRPRSSQALDVREFDLPSTGEKVVVVSSGAIITITDPARDTVIDIEADRIAFWTRGDFQQLFKSQPAAGPNNRSLEFYLSGNVEIRQASGKEARLLRADEVYYDVQRNVAIANTADLTIKQPGLTDPMHFLTPKLLQLNAKVFQFGKSEVNASKLPYSPELKLTLTKGKLEQIEIVKRGFFGLGPATIDPATGLPKTYPQQLFRGNNALVYLGPVPVFYLPFVQGDVNDPLGPLENLMFNYNKIFGFAAYVTLDVYDLFGLVPTPGTRWRLDTDYMSARGPALGTDYRAFRTDFFGIPARVNGEIHAYGIDDRGLDVLGGNRGQTLLVTQPFLHFQDITHPELRGRFTSELNVQELPLGGFLQFKLSAISDRNFLEQFFPNEWQTGINQESYAYLGVRRDNYAITALTQVNDRNWITETEWLPRVDGFWNTKISDLLTYNTQASVGYAHLQPTHQPEPPISITDQNINTARADWTNELSLPFTVGAVRLVPYVVGDVTYYSQDLTGQERTRLYGAGGLRGSIPLSRLFPNVQSEFFNLNGIFHKIVLSGNYYNARSDTPYTRLPQLDRLNDDATDQALRDIRPWEPLFNLGYGQHLVTSPIFDPQTYAIRNLVMSRIDTRDTIEILQMDLRQRWQTKRGLPGAQHIVDWMTLDLSASYFPSRVRDNFGESFAFLRYDYLWHVGDRTSLYSDGWFDPASHGPRIYTFGATTSRPDGTQFSLSYRQLDPLNSRNVLATVSYSFSPKYAFTFATGYDFGNNIQFNTFQLTRTGTDVQVSLGFTYNSVVNTLNFTFTIFPNLLPASKRVPGGLGTFNNGQGVISR